MRGLFVLFFFLLLGVMARSTPQTLLDSFSLEGRWDITLDMEGKKAPSWLEVRHSGNHTLVGDWVGVSGSARPIS